MQAHPLHALLHRRRRPASGLELAQRDAAVLVVCRHLFPLLHSRDSRSPDRVLGVAHGRVGGHVSDLDEGNRDEAGPAEPANGLGYEPLGVGLGDDDDGLAGLGLELVGTLGLEVIHHNAVDHAAGSAARLGAALAGCGGRRHGSCGGRGTLRRGFGVAGVVIGSLHRGRGPCRVGLGAVAFGAPQRLEECDGHKTPRVGKGGVACLVPVCVVLAPDDVEEVAPRETQFLAGLGFIVVEGADDLQQSSRGQQPKADLLLGKGSIRQGNKATMPPGETGAGSGVQRTFLGGTMATADFGAMAIWGALFSLSPLMDRRRALKTRMAVSGLRSRQGGDVAWSVREGWAPGRR